MEGEDAHDENGDTADDHVCYITRIVVTAGQIWPTYDIDSNRRLAWLFQEHTAGQGQLFVEEVAPSVGRYIAAKIDKRPKSGLRCGQERPVCGAAHRLPRAEFYRTCGHNIWRFVRLFLFFVIIAGPITGILGAAQNALVKAADESSNERLPFFIQLACMAIMFLVLTAIRIWFDLAQTQAVVGDQGKVRKSIAAAYRGMKGYRLRLLANYVFIALLAGVVLVLGIWVWIELVPAASVLGAIIVSQIILLFLLAARFWQRACAVAFYRDYMTVLVVERETLPIASVPVIALPDEGGPALVPQT